MSDSVFKVFVSECVVVWCSHINSAHVCHRVRSPAYNELLNTRKIEKDVLYFQPDCWWLSKCESFTDS
jgi:hypothetical protein